MDALNSQQQYWLSLWHISGVGPKTYAKLTHFASKEALFDSDLTQRKSLSLPERTFKQVISQYDAGEKSMHQTLAWLNQSPRHFIRFPDDASYPERLRQIAQPPVLFGRGDPDVLNTLQIAVVGSRNANEMSLRHAFDLSQGLAAHQITITSGLAYGIDSASHKGCLMANGKTIAVLGSAVDHIYPKANSRLADQIVESEGAVISEFSLGTPPKPAHFPQRNRIISGLCESVLVVEAAIKSGSLITAKYALEQNRDVFAIPGSVNDPNKQGCHQLIKQGAVLVDELQDILTPIGMKFQIDFEVANQQAGSQSSEVATSPVEGEPELPADERQLLSALSFDQGKTLDALMVESGITHSALVMQRIQQWVLSGQVIESHPGAYIRLK
ncbi:MAG: DNA-processing protein DprA [Pseudomonadota bacterium]|nr:DNA-processing protein DprA [Pseudomonadota bacterium]